MVMARRLRPSQPDLIDAFFKDAYAAKPNWTFREPEHKMARLPEEVLSDLMWAWNHAERNEQRYERREATRYIQITMGGGGGGERGGQELPPIIDGGRNLPFVRERRSVLELEYRRQVFLDSRPRLLWYATRRRTEGRPIYFEQ